MPAEVERSERPAAPRAGRLHRLRLLPTAPRPEAVHPHDGPIARCLRERQVADEAARGGRNSHRLLNGTQHLTPTSVVRGPQSVVKDKSTSVFVYRLRTTDYGR